jgi:hypothetical protein
MRVCFLILNHRPPEQLLRLLRAIRRQLPDAPLVVHHDRFHTSLDPDVLNPVGGAHLITSDFPVRWGDFSLIDCTWRSMSWIAENIDFDWLVLLSAQDYPIRPLAGLPEHLAGTGADALLTASPIDDLPSASQRRDMRRRYLYQYQAAVTPHAGPCHDGLWKTLRVSVAKPVDVINYVQPYFKIYKFPDAMPWRFGLRALVTPFTADGPCWFGSAWYCLARKAVAYLDQFVQQHPASIDYYRATIYPDESATATILNNAADIVVKPCTTHYAKWTNPRSGHPDILTARDLADLARSPAYFARKFDLRHDRDVLDRLDDLWNSLPEPTR